MKVLCKICVCGEKLSIVEDFPEKKRIFNPGINFKLLKIIFLYVSTEDIICDNQNFEQQVRKF